MCFDLANSTLPDLTSCMYLTEFLHSSVHVVLVSVCEHELETGLISAPLPHKKCVWFRRHINFMDSELEENDHAAKYLDKTDSSDGNQTSAQELLQGLKDHLVKILPSDNVMDYTVDWAPSGMEFSNQFFYTFILRLSLDSTELQ